MTIYRPGVAQANLQTSWSLFQSLYWLTHPFPQSLQNTFTPNIRASNLKLWDNAMFTTPPCVSCCMSGVRFHVSCVMCHVSGDRCQVSYVTCHASLLKKKKNQTKRRSESVEGLLLMGLPHLVKGDLQKVSSWDYLGLQYNVQCSSIGLIMCKVGHLQPIYLCISLNKLYIMLECNE